MALHSRARADARHDCSLRKSHSSRKAQHVAASSVDGARRQRDPATWTFACPEGGSGRVDFIKKLLGGYHPAQT